MHTDLEIYYRLLSRSYRRYLDADQKLASAFEELSDYFPVREIPHRGTIGAPGSRLRQLRDERDDALLRLQSVYHNFRAAQRLIARQHRRPREIFMISLRMD